MSDPATSSAAGASPEPSSPTPVFGSASTFGGGSGFAGFTGVGSSPGFKSAEPAAADADEAAAEGAGAENDEDCSAEFKPVVQLEEVEVQTGEEGEEELAAFKCKLYRFDQESGEWKERGVGPVKLLRHKENDRVRLLMRQDKTLKIRANHIVMPGTNMQEHSGSEKSVVWSAVDFADEKQKTEMFCARFASQERAQEFIGKHAEAMEHNDKVLAADEDAGAEDGEAAEAAPAAGEGATSTSDEAPPKRDAADELADKVGTVSVADKEEAAATTAAVADSKANH